MKLVSYPPDLNFRELYSGAGWSVKLRTDRDVNNLLFKTARCCCGGFYFLERLNNSRSLSKLRANYDNT